MAIQSISEAVKYLEEHTTFNENGLPLDLFVFISKVVPMVNVELLVKNERNDSLLSWRDDVLHGKGWSLPGGVLRMGDTLEKRVQITSKRELGIEVDYDKDPVKTEQVIHGRHERGHFISFVYKCLVPKGYEPKNIGLTPQDNGYLKWFESCPENLIEWHKRYKELIDKKW